MTLKIGHIEYANCTPIFSALQNGSGCRDCIFVTGVPSALNSMLRRGEIDLGPVSSIEYGKLPDYYYLLPGLSISSIGRVKSVLLFSRLPIDELDGKDIGLTNDSDTSVNLLRIILRKHLGYCNDLRRTSLSLPEALREFSALLLIGDAALRASTQNHGLYVYDLGEMWHSFTGLPFVFALWLVTSKAVEEKRDEVAALCTQLLAAKQQAYHSYEEIALTCAESTWMSRDALVDYWRTISYELTHAHLEGIRTFFRYAAELGLIPEEPELRLFSC